MVAVNLSRVCVFQSQQARLATLYLPLFGLLQENVHRLNVKEVSPFPVNHSNNVRLPSSGPLQNLHRYVRFAQSADVSCSCFVFLVQNGRDEPLLANPLMTPPRSSTILDSSLHKDVFGVISGTGEMRSSDGEQTRGGRSMVRGDK